VQKVRESAARTHCSNNLKQIIIGLHNFHSTHQKFPPGYGEWAAGQPPHPLGRGTLFYYVLPFIEQDIIYKLGGGPGVDPNNNPDAYYDNFASLKTPGANEIKIYLCPSDPNNNPSATWTNGWVVGNYAYNHDAFGLLDGGWDTRAYTRMPASFQDGTSNTIAIAEKYAKCGGEGTLWAHGWWNRRWEPRFNHWEYRYSNNPNGSFQLQPTLSTCDSLRLQTPHTGGMNMALVDGSVRFTAGAISGPTLSAASTPREGDNLGPDW
jgi:prepilin-type processing-associated H-X9-DG protein